jgi:hypothetical protein
MGGIMTAQQYTDQQVAAAGAAFSAGDVTYHESVVVQLPPIPDSDPMVPLAVRLPPALKTQVLAAAKAARVPASDLVRGWIELGLTELRSDQVVSLSALRLAIAHAAQSGDAA